MSIASHLSCFHMTLSYAHLEGVWGVRGPLPLLCKLLVYLLHSHSKFTENMPRTSPIPGKLKYPSPLPPWNFFLDPRELILSMLRSAMWPIGLMFLMQWLIVYLVQFMTFFESYLYFTSSVDPYKSTLKSIEINAIGGTLKSRRWNEWIRFGFIVVLCFECFNLLY